MKVNRSNQDYYCVRLIWQEKFYEVVNQLSYDEFLANRNFLEIRHLIFGWYGLEWNGFAYSYVKDMIWPT